MQDIMFQIVTFVKRCFQIDLIDYVCSSYTVNEITAVHRSLSSTISCVTDRIRFLPVTMTGRFSNFNSISYAKDRHELRVTGTNCRLPDTKSGTDKIFISSPVMCSIVLYNYVKKIVSAFSKKSPN